MSRQKTPVSDDGRVCTMCRHHRKWHEFPLDKLGINGRKPSCKLCVSAKNKTYDWTAYRLRRHVENPARRLFIASRHRSKWEHSITLVDAEAEYAKTSGRCPILGCRKQFQLECHGSDRFAAPSLDRIDSARGYVPGNVWVICFECNSAKRHWTAERFELLAKSIRKATSDRSS